MGWKFLTVMAASTAPAIPPENRDNAGDIWCLTAIIGLGLCVVLFGLVKPTENLVVEAIEAIVNNDCSILHCLGAFPQGFKALGDTAATSWDWW